jgi:hypothetical protein
MNYERGTAPVAVPRLFPDCCSCNVTGCLWGCSSEIETRSDGTWLLRRPLFFGRDTLIFSICRCDKLKCTQNRLSIYIYNKTTTFAAQN